MIDRSRLAAQGLIVPGGTPDRIAGEFRVIKRPLLARAFSHSIERTANDQVIMVSSARPGEGKTFVAVNLAMSIASEADVHVLLIDTDIYRHDLQRVLDIPAERGLVDMLDNDRLALPDVLVRTDIPTLTVLPAGRRHPNATELLASRRMAALFHDIITRYPDRIVIIDTPPALASTEAGVIAAYAGQAVLVVERGATSRRAVERALSILAPCRHINFVLNKLPPQVANHQYGAYDTYDTYGAGTGTGRRAEAR